MYNVKWDNEENGIILTEEDSQIVPPRPVFFEELDLLGFDKFWKYPNAKAPLLWASGRNYFYKGQLVAKTTGGSIFEHPNISIFENGSDLELKPVNIKNLIEKNREPLFVLENETIDFIEHVFKMYNNEDCVFSISFSGGKDSHTVLDLVTRVIPSEELIAIFADTTLENHYTYDNVENTIKDYKIKYPKLNFLKSKPPKSALEFFEEFGLPSRFHRWCTPVLKTAPINNLIRKHFKNNSKVLVFEGVRAEESKRRSNYQRIAGGVKHLSVINARPILYWNFSEVILYNLYRNLRMNKSYRFGLSRVGCTLCPASSEWSEHILSNMPKRSIQDYIPLLREYAEKRGLKNEKDINKFIDQGQWKKRAGGKGLKTGTSITFSESDDIFKSIILNPKEEFLEWIKVLGNAVYKKDKDSFYGEFKIDDFTYPFKKKSIKNKEIIEIYNIEGNIGHKSKLRRVLHKSTFCAHCGVCEAECSTGALQTTPQLYIDTKLCVKCNNCLYLAVNGCLLSKSVYENIGGGGSMKKTGGIDKYSTFGIREEWLTEFLNTGDNWLENNNLGPKQVQAMIRWLIDAELIDGKTKKVTALESLLKEIYKTEPLFVWHVIWNNLYYNSPVIKWYCDTVNWSNITSKSELKENIRTDFPNLSKGTLSNPIDAMVNMFDNSPLGEESGLGILEKKGRIVKSIKKIGTDNINPFVVAYNLYKVGEYNWRKDFTVSELYNKRFRGGPYQLFGISRDQFERTLRGLQEDKEQILRVDLTADLDNIYLKEDISTFDIIKIASERLK